MLPIRLLDWWWWVQLLRLLLVVGVAWAVLSVFAAALRYVLELLGLTRFREWIAAQLRQIWFPVAWGSAAALAGPAPDAGDGASVRLILDEKLKSLREAMARTVTAVREAASGLASLGSTTGPLTLSGDVRRLQERVEEVAGLGGEIDADQMLADYQGHSRSAATLIFLVFFSVVACLVNGTMLNAFFKGVISGEALGVRLSTVLAMVFVLLEIAFGFLASYYRKSRLAFWVFIVTIVCGGLVEFFIFGLMSSNFDFNVPALEGYEAWKFWLGFLGAAVVAATSGAGYALHFELEKLSETRGAGRLGREAKALNALIRVLPERWEGIRRNAQAAESSISAFEEALGSKDGSLVGAIGKVAEERQALLEALAGAKVDEWEQWVVGRRADERGARMLEMALGVLSLALLSAYVWLFQHMLKQAFLQLPWLVLLGGAVIATFAFYSIGFLSFARIQLSESGKARVFSERAGAVELAAAIVAGVGATAAILYISVALPGGVGAAYGLILIAGGAVLATLGYQFERAMSGVFSVGRLLVILLFGGLAVLVVAGCYVVGLAAWILLSLLWIVICFLALPTWEVFLPAWQRRRPQRPSGGPRAAVPSTA